MTRLETKSMRKALAIRTLVNSGEYSPAYALDIVEKQNDEGLMLDADYDPLAKWLTELIQQEQETPEEEEQEEQPEEENEIVEE